MAHHEYETFEHAFLRNIDEPGADFPNLFSYYHDYDSLARALCKVLSRHNLDFRKVFHKIELNAYDYGESIEPSILYKHMIAIPGCDPASKSHFGDLEPIDREIYDNLVARDEGEYEESYRGPDEHSQYASIFGKEYEDQEEEDDEDEIFVKPAIY